MKEISASESVRMSEIIPEISKRFLKKIFARTESQCEQSNSVEKMSYTVTDLVFSCRQMVYVGTDSPE